MTVFTGGPNATMPNGIVFDTLDESFVSVADGLVFPNVQTCMALIVRASPQGMLGGYHTTIATTQPELNTIAGHIASYLTSGFSEIYLLGAVSLRATGQSVAPESRFRGPLALALRQAFNYPGKIYYFDTSEVINGGWTFAAWRDPASNQIRLTSATAANASMARTTGPDGRVGAAAAPQTDRVRRWIHQTTSLARKGEARFFEPRLVEIAAGTPILANSLATL